MFTVKHITPNSESLFEVNSVSLDKSASSTTAGDKGLGTLFLHTTDGATGSIDAGKAYVMNRDGATVASYDFGN